MEASMGSIKHCLGALVGASFFAFAFTAQPASAITAELAKKCRDMALKAHPPARPGSKPGAAKAQQEYYRTCVSKDGKME
jgi:hypothetical protein